MRLPAMVMRMRGKLGRNNVDFKRTNRSLTLELIATGECTSRADLARATGLSKMTISNIIGEMMEQGIVSEEEGEQKEAKGRNPSKLSISKEVPKIIGVVILRSHCEAVLCDMNLNILERHTELNVNPSAENLIRNVFQLVDTIMTKEENIISIGVASIGPVNSKNGMILHPYYFHDIEKVEVVKELENRYHVPVYMDNDNQSAVLAEKLYGQGRAFENILFVGIKEGVGCGIVNHNKIFTDVHGFQPELGHVSIDYQGIPCVCGNQGCVERYINSTVLLDKMQEATDRYFSYADFCSMTEEESVMEILEEAIDKLSYALINSINLLNPEVIYLGQDCVYWPESCVKSLEDKINSRKFSDKNFRIQVKKATFMEDELVLGAACNSIYELFRGRDLFNSLIGTDDTKSRK